MKQSIKQPERIIKELAVPKVSVIIPTYNPGDFLKTTAESVLCQSCGDLELLVIDDGSSENVKAVAESLNGERVRYFRKENGGTAGARNYGLARSKGEFIAFLDQDDLWPKDFLAKMILSLEEHPDYGVAYCGIVQKYPDGKLVQWPKPPKKRSGFITVELFKKGFIWPSASLIRKSALKDIRFDDFLKQSYEDADFFLRLSAKARFLWVDSVEAIRREHDKNLSAKVGVKPTRILVLERFYYRLGGKDIVPSRIARKKLSHACRKVARSYLLYKKRAASIHLFKKAIFYWPLDIRLYKDFLKALVLSKMKDTELTWKTPEMLSDPLCVEKIGDCISRLTLSRAKNKKNIFEFYFKSALKGIIRGLYKVSLKLFGKKFPACALDSILSLLVKTPRNKKGVLLVRLDVIGDFVMWLSQAGEYRNIYPDEKIVLLGHKRWFEFAKIFDFWDEVWEFDSDSFMSDPICRITTICKIRRAGFKVAIQPTHVRFLYADMIIKSSGADIKIGSVGDPKHLRSLQSRVANKWYSQLVPAKEGVETMLYREAEFTGGVSRLEYSARVSDIRKYLSPASIVTTLPENYYVLCPGSGVKYKQWSLAKFAKVAEMIHKKWGLTALLCGGANEKQLVGEIRDLCKLNFWDMIGQASLIEFCHLINNAKLVLCNDSCAVHIAAAVRTPCVCVLGGGQFGRCLPYCLDGVDAEFEPKVCFDKMDCFGCNWTMPCLRKRYGADIDTIPCVENVSVEDVFDKCESLLYRNCI